MALTDRDKLIIKTKYLKDLKEELLDEISKLSQSNPDEPYTDTVTKHGILSVKCTTKSFKVYLDNINKEIPKMEELLKEQKINDEELNRVSDDIMINHYWVNGNADTITGILKDVVEKFDTFDPKTDPECSK